MAKITPAIKLNGNFKGKDILSLDQFDIISIDKVFEVTKKMADIAQNAKASSLLAGNIATLLFYEPSSRTFGSFSASVKQLGGQTVEIIDPAHFSSVTKGETFADTIRVFEAYCDAIVLRHTEIGAAKKAAEVAKYVPIINAGDGAGEHPTQALLDMYTIYERHRKLSNLTLVFAGDILYGRTVHSLLRGLALFPGNKAYLLSPKELKLTREDYYEFSSRGIKIIEIESEKDIPKNAHVWYWTRVQKERFTTAEEYEQVKNKFIVTPKLLEEYGNDNLILMHPLPRIGEITQGVDRDPRAVFLTSEIRNGMYVRMALLALVLGKV